MNIQALDGQWKIVRGLGRNAQLPVQPRAVVFLVADDLPLPVQRRTKWSSSPGKMARAVASSSK